MKIKIFLTVCLLLASLSGCAPKIYHVNLSYQPTKKIEPILTDGRALSVTVSELIDTRKIDDPLLVGNVIRRDGTTIPVLPRYNRVPDAVTDVLRRILSQLAFHVSPTKVLWNLQEDTILPSWGTILIGGRIDELRIICHDDIAVKKYAANAEITLFFADVQKKKIFYHATAKSSSTLEHVFFSEEKLETQISGVLFEAAEKIVTAPETIRQIHQILKH